MEKKRIKYFLENWKVGIHLIFRTKRFGVNNQWWSPFDSMFGWSNRRRLWNIIKIRPMIENYKHMKLRAGRMCHFINDEDYKECFGESK